MEAETNPATQVQTGPGCLSRPATPGDEEFLGRLFAETQPALQLLPPQLRSQLAAMQYAGRRQTYAEQYPAALDSILLSPAGEPIGRHLVLSTGYGYRGIDLAILPAYQSKGFGTAALKLIQQQARHAGGEFHLRVLRSNPALRLYLRLGFVPITEDELAFEMIWSAIAPGSSNR